MKPRRSQIESGAELLARLNSKPSLYGLEDTMFIDGPRNKDIMEIGGERSSGKTLLLSQILAKCILPNYYQSVQIKGCNASAVLINTDHHFQISKLIEIMNDIIDTASTVSFASQTLDIETDKIIIVQNSLRNLHVIDCYDSEQFAVTLRTLDDMFLDNAKIAVLAIDSMTAYYWQDYENNVIAIDTYVKKLLKLIRMHTTQFNVVTIYTRSYESINNKKEKFSNNIDYKVHLCRMHNSRNLICTLQTALITRKIYYSILSSGIKWETDERDG